jgi:methionyl-tRNA formyltransferase
MRLLIFTDVPGEVSARLTEATLRAVRARGDLEVCGIVCSRPRRFEPPRRSLLRRAVVAAANRDLSWATVFPKTLDLARLEREHGIPLLVPEDGDPNHPAFVARLARDIRADVALSYECLAIFRRPLLDAFPQAVNYHAGLLARCRGVMATSFSVLAGDAESGFTFHRMIRRVDAGPILEEGAVPVGDATAAEVGLRKLALAVHAVPRVLDWIASGDPGRVPSRLGPLYTTADWMAWTGIERPEDVTEAQLRQRLRAFGTVRLTVAGMSYPVTRVRPAPRSSRFAFTTADGHVLAPDRLDGLPLWLHRTVSS